MAEALPVPTISIVTPSFNRKKYLAATMESILGQGYPELEYVVVDGGSTDGSVELIDERSEELAWSVSEPDSGPWEAINKGFVHTSGEVMGWLGSDDLLLPWSLSIVGELFSAFPQIEWLTTAFQSTCDENGRIVSCYYHTGYSREGFFRGRNLPGIGAPEAVFIQQESTFWRRSLWERTGSRLDDSLQLAADFELWARFHRAPATLYAVATSLGAFRAHGDQKSQADRTTYLQEAREVLHRYGSSSTRPSVGAVRRALALVSPQRFQGHTLPADRGARQPVFVHRGPELGWRLEYRDT